MIGYCVPIVPNLASYRLRVAIPARHMGVPYRIGCTGSPTFFFKNGNVRLAASLQGGVVYDVVNDHFSGRQAEDYHGMCRVADLITCASPRMAEIVRSTTGKTATVVDDPYENDEEKPDVLGSNVVWFGHQANFESLRPYADINPLVCTGDDWSLVEERRALQAAAVIFLTGSNPGASANRPVKAIRAGRFVVAPDDCPESWRDLSEYMWIGDVREGIKWALNNREEACKKILAGQHYIRQRFSPSLIGLQWAALFDSISGQDTAKKKVGLG